MIKKHLKKVMAFCVTALMLAGGSGGTAACAAVTSDASGAEILCDNETG